MKRSASALLDNDTDGTSAAILLACMASASTNDTETERQVDVEGDDGDDKKCHDQEGSSDDSQDAKQSAAASKPLSDNSSCLVDDEIRIRRDVVVPKRTATATSTTKPRATSPQQQQPPMKSARISSTSEKEFIPRKHGSSLLSVKYDGSTQGHNPITYSPSSSSKQPLDCFKLASSALSASSRCGPSQQDSSSSSNNRSSSAQRQLHHTVADPSLPQYPLASKLHPSQQQQQKRPSTNTTPTAAEEAKANDTTDATPTLFTKFSKADENRAVTLEEETERIIAREFNKLSMTGKVRAHDELHGRRISSSVEGQDQSSSSSPSSSSSSTSKLKQVQSLLQQVDIELRQLVHQSDVDTGAYEHALSLSPRIVHDDEAFKLMFLRAEEYRPRKAAQRIARYFTGKLEIWGLPNLVTDITYDKLTDDDRKALLSGMYQICPDLLDKTGRLVSFLYEAHNTSEGSPVFKSWQSRARVLWYLWSKVIKDIPECQRQGVVCIIYNVNKSGTTTRTPDSSFVESITKSHLFHCLPVRVVGYHHCFNNPLLRHAMALLKVGLSPDLQVRFQKHYGTDLEVQYSLGAFGISEKSLPVDRNGKLYTDRHVKYVEQLKLCEQQDAFPTDGTGRGVNTASTESPVLTTTSQSSGTDQDNVTSISSKSAAKLNSTNSIATTNNAADDDLIRAPNPNDVLLGRGRLCQNHHGTIEFNKLVEKYRMQYQIAETHIEKTTINQLIVQLIHEQNGRFLQRDKKSGLWKEVPIEIAWERVGRRYRK